MLIAAISLVVHYQLTWVSFLPLQTIFSMLSVGSGNARNSWDPTVLRSNGRATSVEEPCCCEELQPPGGLSNRDAKASASEENPATTFNSSVTE